MHTSFTVPKAELHVHLEAALTPKLARSLAQQQGIVLPESIFLSDDQFACSNYYDFMKAYDIVAHVVCTAQAYREVTYEYLHRSHMQGCIYTELSVSPTHAALVGLAYPDMLAGVVQGIDDARRDFGIESRIIIMFVRHYGSEHAERIEKEIIKYHHPYVVGVGLAGMESSMPAKAFARAFSTAREAGLHCTAHAGEALGPESVWEVLECLPVERIGHGIRSIEDPRLIATLCEKDIALEVCITSNIVTGCYANLDVHPFLHLYNAGVSLSLNSDDPTFFGSSIQGEYIVAQEKFGLSDAQLVYITHDAIQHSFAPKELKKSLSRFFT